MRVRVHNGLAAAAVLSLAVPAGIPEARAEVAASEVLTWCSGASQSGQLGAINAFRCVNYLQGAADMVSALAGTDLGACLGGDQSAGAQLMARFIPDLKARANEEDVDATPMARHVADWLATACRVELAVAGTEPAAEPAAPDPAAAEEMAAALTEARADAAAYAAQIRDLQAALEVAVTGRQEELAACTAQVDELTADLAAAEAEAADRGMRVAELELELEGVNAEAMARRQEIEEAERQVAALTADLHAALADRLAAEQALSEARQEIETLQAAVAENGSTGSGRVEAAEERAAAAEARVSELEAALAAVQTDLAEALALADDQATRLASLSADLDACRVSVASAGPVMTLPPPPALTPARAAAPTPPPPPNIVTTPTPATASSSDSPGSGTGTGVPTSSITVSRAESPRPLDAVGVQALRQMQQVTLRQNAVGQRRSWATPDGRYTGFIVVLREGYDGPDYCREIYSEARADSSIVHQSTEIYCQTGNLWVFIPPGR